MPSAPENLHELVWDLFSKRISKDDFPAAIHATLENMPSVISQLFAQGIQEKNPELIGSASILMYTYGIDGIYLEHLNALANETWHRNHEDIVFALGKIKDPSSVEPLSKSALVQHPYLENDDAYALGSKCIYALKNIQTPEAIHVLGDLARNENEILRTTAIGRLEDIAKKGESEAARTLAQTLLDR